jgi:hypothetical protein
MRGSRSMLSISACGLLANLGCGSGADASGASPDGASRDESEASDSPSVTSASDAGESSVGSDAGCGDTRSDPYNCGRCGHACLEGVSCRAGVCQTASDGGESADASDAADAGDSGDSRALPSCVGALTFRLGAPAGPIRYCENLDCQYPNFFSVSDGNGNALTTAMGCLSDCSTCRIPSYCYSQACGQSLPLSDAGEQSSWDGILWTNDGVCADGTACAQAHCAPAGQYTAHMCAYPVAPTDASACLVARPSSTPTCVDVQFQYPGQPVVAGMLP